MFACVRACELESVKSPLDSERTTVPIREATRGETRQKFEESRNRK